MVTDVTACWKVWVPLQFLNFYMTPVHLRAIGVMSLEYRLPRGNLDRPTCKCR